MFACQNPPVFRMRHNRILQVAIAFINRLAILQASLRTPKQRFWLMGKPRQTSQGPGQFRCLVVAPGNPPRPMYRDRNQDRLLAQNVPTGRCHPSCGGQRKLGSVAVLQGQHQPPPGTFVRDRRTPHPPWPGYGDAIVTQIRHTIARPRQPRPAVVAGVTPQEDRLAPAIRAKRPAPVDQGRTENALIRIDQRQGSLHHRFNPLSASAAMSQVPTLTDRACLALRRTRAERAPVTFLWDEIANDIEERLDEVNKSFSAPAIVGHDLIQTPPWLADAVRIEDRDRLDTGTARHDLIIHAALHWANDPVGQLVQCRLALKPDGLLIAALPGGQSLHELRTAIAEAESRLTGGLSPRVMPMADVRDLGALLQRAGLALPVADSRRLTVRYHSLAALIRDLRGMGETNALAARLKAPAPRALFDLAEQIYRDTFADADGYLPATIEIVFLTGWAPDPSQQKPLQPGSAKARLADALGTTETPAGEHAASRKR